MKNLILPLCAALSICAVSQTKTATERPRITAIDHVAFYTTNPDYAKKLYGEILGLATADPIEPGETVRYMSGKQWVGYAAAPDPTFELLRNGQADAFASVRSVLLAYAPKLPGSRVLEDHYGANLLGMVVPKGQTARLAYITEFIEQAKASGLAQQAIERSGLPGHQVAPAKTN